MVNNAKNGFTLAEVLITLVIIGIVAALTIPVAISKYKKTEVETRLKKSYSTLSNAVKRATADHGDVSTWSFGTYDNFEGYLDKYFLPYIRNSKGSCSIAQNLSPSHRPQCTLYLADGTVWTIKGYEGNPMCVEIMADINGNKKPNKVGYDRFYFYILPAARSIYNAGDGNYAYNVPGAGVYYDGYGASKNTLINDQYRGCSNSCNYNSCMKFCIALIVRNGWRIPDDYPIKF